MSATIRWVDGQDPLSLWHTGYDAYLRDLQVVVEDVVARRSDEILAWMRANHPWRNRTGLAERSLGTTLVTDIGRVVLVMYHGTNVPYSRFLELFMRAPGAPTRFSVLRPALDYWSPILIEDIQKAIRP